MNSKFHVEITDTAFNDLRKIWAHIAQDRPIAADRLVPSILEQIVSLETFPLRCPRLLEPGLDEKEYRQLIHDPYRLIFRVHEKTVSVVQVLHGARLLD